MLLVLSGASADAQVKELVASSGHWRVSSVAATTPCRLSRSSQDSRVLLHFLQET